MKIVPSRLAVSSLPPPSRCRHSPERRHRGTAPPFPSPAPICWSRAEGQGASRFEQLRAAIREELIRRDILSRRKARQGQGLDKSATVQAPDGHGPPGRADPCLPAGLRRRPSGERRRRQGQNPRQDQDPARRQGNTRPATSWSRGRRAKAIIAKLDKGKIEDLAKAVQDPGSKDKGGDLGIEPTPAQLRRSPSSLVHRRKNTTDDTATPVRRPILAYHVIKLEDTPLSRSHPGSLLERGKTSSTGASTSTRC